MSGAATIDVDTLPPTQYLILEVLAARYRTGESTWTFPSRLKPALDALSAAGLIVWKRGFEPGTALAWFTDAGRAAATSGTYVPPNQREPVRVVVVVDWKRGRVYDVTTDDEAAQEEVRGIVAEHDGDQLAASMTVALVKPS